MTCLTHDYDISPDGVMLRRPRLLLQAARLRLASGLPPEPLGLERLLDEEELMDLKRRDRDSRYHAAAHVDLMARVMRALSA
ncbi:MAG: DUF6477 family protein [Pseudomonadota bacterium]